MDFKAVCCAGASFCAAIGLSGAAQATEPLAWSLAATGVGVCTHTPCIEGTTLTYLDRDAVYGPAFNAASSSADVTYGAAHGWVAPGAGDFGLPQLHADAAGRYAAGQLSYNYAVLDAVQAYRWNGASGIDLGVDTFVGVEHDTIGSGGFGLVNASIAIISSALRDNDALGRAWYSPNSHWGFTATCATEGAIGIGSHEETDLGTNSNLITPSCGAATFHLDPGEEFFVWAKLEAFRLSTGVTDASDTFTVALNPALSADTLKALHDDLVPAPALTGISAVPEPMSWALMLLGFGGIGLAARQRRAAA